MFSLFLEFVSLNCCNALHFIQLNELKAQTSLNNDPNIFRKSVSQIFIYLYLYIFRNILGIFHGNMFSIKFYHALHTIKLPEQKHLWMMACSFFSFLGLRQKHLKNIWKSVRICKIGVAETSLNNAPFSKWFKKCKDLQNCKSRNIFE